MGCTQSYPHAAVRPAAKSTDKPKSVAPPTPKPTHNSQQAPVPANLSPPDNNTRQPHKVPVTEPSRPINIGAHAGAAPSHGDEPLTLMVRDKPFSWSNDTFRFRHASGAPLGNGLQVKGKALSWKHQMALLDGNGKMLAVCLKKFTYLQRVFKIYLPYPTRPNQKPSEQMYSIGQKLYTYCEVRRIPFSRTQEVWLDRAQSPTWPIQRKGWLPKSRVVKRTDGRKAALIEGGTWSTNFNVYTITVSPKEDPCLMVLLCAIFDEMDEDANN